MIDRSIVAEAEAEDNEQRGKKRMTAGMQIQQLAISRDRSPANSQLFIFIDLSSDLLVAASGHLGTADLDPSIGFSHFDFL